MVNFCLDSHSSLWYYLGADKSADLKGAVFAKKYIWQTTGAFGTAGLH